MWLKKRYIYIFIVILLISSFIGYSVFADSAEDALTDDLTFKIRNIATIYPQKIGQDAYGGAMSMWTVEIQNPPDWVTEVGDVFICASGEMNPYLSFYTYPQTVTYNSSTNSDIVTVSIENDLNTRKALYYGYGGPEQWPGFTSISLYGTNVEGHYYQITHMLASAYSTHTSNFTFTNFRGYSSLKAYVESMPAPPDDFIVIKYWFGQNWQHMLSWVRGEQSVPGYLQVHKDVNACNLTTNPQNVSPAGAVYSIFDTKAHAQAFIDNNSTDGRLTTLTIGANGDSVSGGYQNSGQYRTELKPTGANSYETETVYVVESKLPDEVNNDKFIWDKSELSKIYEATITKDNTENNPVMVNSKNCYGEQGWAYVEKMLNVTSQNAKDMNISGTIVYSIKDSTNKEVATVNVVFSKGEIVKSSPAIKLPVGTYTITEISTPDTIIKNSTPKSFTLTRNHTKDNPCKVSFTNDVVSQIKIHKVSNRLDLANKYPITGAVYTLYTDSGHNNIAKDIYGNNATFTINSQGNSEARLMKAGTYYIKETVVPNNYKTGTITPNPIILRSGDIKMIEGENVLDSGKGKVVKEY